MVNPLYGKSAASAKTKVKYNVSDLKRNPRSSTVSVRKRFNKAMRRAVRQFIINANWSE